MKEESRLISTERRKQIVLSRYYEPRMHNLDDEWLDDQAPITKRLLHVL